MSLSLDGERTSGPSTRARSLLSVAFHRILCCCAIAAVAMGLATAQIQILCAGRAIGCRTFAFSCRCARSYGVNVPVAGASHRTGQDIRSQNVTACIAIANIVKSTLGPVGLDKMLVRWASLCLHFSLHPLRRPAVFSASHKADCLVCVKHVSGGRNW